MTVGPPGCDNELATARAADLAGFAQRILDAAAQAPLGGSEIEQLQARLDALLGPYRDVLALRPSECQRFITERLADVRTTACRLGYAVAVHGSLARDIDLVAVPWVEDAAAPRDLVTGLMRTLGRCDFCDDKQETVRPHGRRSWSIWLHEYSTYIDLSVMTPDEGELVVTGRIAPVFEHRIPVTKVDDQLVRDLVDANLWRLALANLYLKAGLYVPAEAKAHGASFGYCDALGNLTPKPTATHFGWTTEKPL